jgi:hypothetical protein
MREVVVISDTSCLISLSRIEGPHLLKAEFRISPQILEELLLKSGEL